METFKMLRTDYVDAVFDGLRKYLQVINPDGTYSFSDVTQYTVKEGAFFGAKDINAMNTAMNSIMAALNNGTNLYEMFTEFFENQKELFQNSADDYTLEFSQYIARLKTSMDAQWGVLEKNYITEIDRFENIQEASFNTWFEMIRRKLSDDAAGNLQLQVTELIEKMDNLHGMLLDGYARGYLYDDSGNYLMSSIGEPILIGHPICKCQNKKEEK